MAKKKVSVFIFYAHAYKKLVIELFDKQNRHEQT
jgi:hypothetical protein